MFAAPTSAAPPHPDQPAGEPTRSAFLLTLLRTLVAFGVNMRQALCNLPSTDTAVMVKQRFGLDNTQTILNHIAYALRLAANLEQRIIRSAKNLDRPRPDPAESSATDEPPEPASDPEASATPDRQPTTRGTAARPRPKSIGAIIAEISRTLGIIASDKYWLDIVKAVCSHRGSWMRLLREARDRARRTGFIPPDRYAWRPPATTGPIVVGATAQPP